MPTKTLVATLVCTGCATLYGTVLQKDNGTYTVITKAQNERDALRMA